ncbi:nucleotide disphospho-sugar-binding domain-containing protein [Mycobacterium sp. NPDC051804]|uniref:nucleotide disphospho-sugar-binding domain-containing protein n=1 Tax=Mycobacterium sp. NPDC051804 TaxID=3364295 RepID=UPI0037910B82
MGRIVVAASSLSGHVLPMMHIGSYLRQSDHDVVVVSAPEFRDDVERAGLRLVSLGPAARVRPPSHSPRIPMPNLLRRLILGLAELESTFVSPLAAQFETLEQVLSEDSVDVIFADLTFTGVLPLLLREGPRPAVFVVGVGPVTLSSADTPPFGMAWAPRPGMDYDGVHRVVQGVLLRGVQKSLNRALDALGARPSPVSLVDWPRLADRLVQLTVPAFEYPRRDIPESVDFVGPVLPGDVETFNPPDWWPEVVTARTVVHVTQGTFDNHDHSRLIGATVAALDGTDTVVVATTGRAFEPITLPPNVFVAEWLPYHALLPHVDVMVTNGGYGGVQHALRYGIPLIVAGETSDKAEVAARVAYTGVGVNLGTNTPSPAQINSAIDVVLARTGYRAAAERIGADIAASQPLDSIGQLVSDVMHTPTVHT